jgi:hypothetical protein
MNLIPVYTTAFNKDFKRLEKRGVDLEKLRLVITLLLAGELPWKSSSVIIPCEVNTLVRGTVISGQIGY